MGDQRGYRRNRRRAASDWKDHWVEWEHNAKTKTDEGKGKKEDAAKKKRTKQSKTVVVYGLSARPLYVVGKEPRYRKPNTTSGKKRAGRGKQGRADVGGENGPSRTILTWITPRPGG